MSDRPVFVPKSKRRPKKQYFHGAFTGGFSAGYFNTVGSKEGWTPRDMSDHTLQENAPVGEEQSSKKTSRPIQKMEDYMDEQDHNEWGGPTSVKKEFEENQQQTSIRALQQIIAEPPANLGLKLLRVLGWRESSSAYVPLDASEEPLESAPDEYNLLSTKRLKRIRLQQSRIKIPPPKLDHCGLGFNPHSNAPEFQKHLEKRKQAARERARAATGQGGGRNVYRMSHLLNDSNVGSQKGNELVGVDDHNVSYETIQDFVGKRSVGGFALREDEDDVYDEQSIRGRKSTDTLQVDDSEYDSVVYNQDSDDDHSDTKDSTELGGLFASWASGKGAKSSAPAQEMTSDGRPPLTGFVLGSTVIEKKKADKENVIKRYPGPDVPVNYAISRHVFADDELPKVDIVGSTSLHRPIRLEQKHSAANQRGAYPSGPMAGATFANIGAAMRSRFTSAEKSVKPPESRATHSVGLHRPQPNKFAADREEIGAGTTHTDKEGGSISIKRTVMPFFPEPLLCKRFNASVPKSIVHPSGVRNSNSPASKAEQDFFQNEVLKHTTAKRDKQAGTGTSKLVRGDGGSSDDDKHEGQADAIKRPPVELLKSIFEPLSASEESDQESGIIDDEDQTEEKAVVPELKVGKGTIYRSSDQKMPGVDGRSAVAYVKETGKQESTESPSKRVSQVGKDQRRGDSSRENRKRSRRRENGGDSDASSDSYRRKRRRKEKKRNKDKARKRKKSDRKRK